MIRPIPPPLLTDLYDEFKIAESIEDGAKIDVFGVGMRMGVSADAPYTDMAYKLVE